MSSCGSMGLSDGGRRYFSICFGQDGNDVITWISAIFMEILILIAITTELHASQDVLLDHHWVSHVGHIEAVPSLFVASDLNALVCRLL